MNDTLTEAQRTKKDTEARRRQVYPIELTAKERDCIIFKLERLGSAREPFETRFLDKLRKLKPRIGGSR